ncbi:MAG: hypothetical protein WDN31_04505 [Hyphomicrobium sp.]
MIGTATAVEPRDERAVDASPITTAALTPAGEAVATRREESGTIAALHLREPIVPLADAGPTVQLAAASNIATDMPADLPILEASTPPLKKITARDADAVREAVVQAKPKAQRKQQHVTRAYRTPIAKPVRRGSRDPMLVQRAPRWSQQMYVSPWQTQAFSYTR